VSGSHFGGRGWVTLRSPSQTARQPRFEYLWLQGDLRVFDDPIWSISRYWVTKTGLYSTFLDRRARARGAADECGAGDALPQGQQDRPQRRGRDPVSRHPPEHAVRDGQECGAAGPARAAPGAGPIGQEPHRPVQPAARSVTRPRRGGADRSGGA
jgi:hypothetical protein